MRISDWSSDVCSADLRPPSWRLFYCPSQKGRTMTTATGAAAPKSSFWASGHWPTLVAAFLYFDLAFMVWVILGPLAHAISEDLDLTSAEKGLMVAVTQHASAVLRVSHGLPHDRLGPERSGAITPGTLITGSF